MKYFPVNPDLGQCFATQSKHLLVGAFVLVAMIMGFATPAVPKTYVEIAHGLVTNLPGDARIREDLEAELLDQANAYRASRGVGALKPSAVMQEAARAQARESNS